MNGNTFMLNSSFAKFDDDARSMGDMASLRSLSDVPEEGPFTPISPDPNSPYFNPPNPATASSSTINTIAATPSRLAPNGRSTGAKKSTSQRSLSRTSSETLPGSSRKVSSTPSTSGTSSSKDTKTSRSNGSAVPKIRTTPRLPHDKDAEPAPSTAMYWSRAPVYGSIPLRSMRGHSVTLVDSLAWVFGGCDDAKETSREMYCFDIETMQWSHPDVIGDLPPPSRAHTASLVDRKIVVYGGGQGGTYYDTVYVFDTTTRRWSKPSISGEIPPPRRAHTAVVYQGKIWVFGGGNGMMALNDVWALELSGGSKMRWTQIRTQGTPPTPRGYHTVNLVGNKMIIVGGSDGKDCFSEIWLLNLDTQLWQRLELPKAESIKRLSHTSTQVGSYLFIQGGHDGTEYISSMHFFNLVNLQYETRLVYGRPPTPRGYHVGILADSRLFFFGGYNGNNAFDDVYIVDLAASAYLPQVTSFTVEP